MKIYTVTGNFFGSVANLFRDYGEVQILPKDYQDLEVDLLIYTGGEDIHPARYTTEIVETSWTNEKRDAWEFKVFEDVLNGVLKVRKNFGICRGLQLMNVGFGGTLVQDIPTHYGKAHKPIHPVRWLYNIPMSDFLSEVNSMHHQGILSRGSRKLSSRVLGVEPETGLVESILWGDSYFAVQFHPEFFGDEIKDIRDKFAEMVAQWVLGKESIFSAPKPEMKKTAKYYAQAAIEASTAIFQEQERLTEQMRNSARAVGNWGVNLPFESDSDVVQLFEEEEEEE